MDIYQEGGYGISRFKVKDSDSNYNYIEKKGGAPRFFLSFFLFLFILMLNFIYAKGCKNCIC